MPRKISKGLTSRESQALALLAEGHADKIIAYKMGISPATVKAIISNARRRWKIPHNFSRTQLAYCWLAQLSEVEQLAFLRRFRDDGRVIGDRVGTGGSAGRTTESDADLVA